MRALLKDDTKVDAKAVALTVVGTPTKASVLACTCDELSLSTDARTNEKVTCKVTVKDDVAETTALVTVFKAPTSTGGSGISLVTGDSTKKNGGGAFLHRAHLHPHCA